LILRPTSDNAQFMRPVIVNGFPPLILIFQTSVEYVCCEIISADYIEIDISAQRKLNARRHS